MGRIFVTETAKRGITVELSKRSATKELGVITFIKGEKVRRDSHRKKWYQYALIYETPTNCDDSGGPSRYCFLRVKKFYSNKALSFLFDGPSFDQAIKEFNNIFLDATKNQ
uniref:Uncharacterized protein n=1 Tax=Nicotiana tabacum TaxID=4097 RepID=A0A1S3XZ75_TOBAC|nr:PREDICTED: uncharacterized protein LOC107770356 [Nicotiana tabacum]